MIPEDLRYTAEHEWVRVSSDGTARVGITDYAQRQLGDIVFVQLPEVGQQVTEGDPVGEVESTKSVSEIFAPLAGEVVEVNSALADAPETVNDEPYGDGWLFELRPSDDGRDQLLDASAYRNLTDPS